jgi:hypothetical protein
MRALLIAGRRCFAIAVTLLTLAVAPRAHHSIAGIYDGRNPISFEAVVIEFQFVNPHPFVVVERTQASGAAQQWRLEMDNRFELVRVGMTGDTLRKGDRIRVTGSIARDKSPALYIRRLERPADGFWYEQVGSSPTIGKPRAGR